MSKKKSKRKKRRNLGPRRKRFKKAQRLLSARNLESERFSKALPVRVLWRRYAKWFGVSKLCAAHELRELGYAITDQHLAALREAERQVNLLREKRRKKSEENEVLDLGCWWDWEEHYAVNFEEIEILDDEIPF